METPVTNRLGRAGFFSSRSRLSASISKLIDWSVEDLTLQNLKLTLQAEAERPRFVILSDVSGKTALHLACEKGYAKVVKLLLEHGARSDAVDKQGNTPLMACARHLQEEAARALILGGGDVQIQAKDNFGDTALSLACANKGSLPLVKLLVDSKAEVTRRNTFGEGPLHKASRAADNDVIGYLLSINQDELLAVGQNGLPQDLAGSEATKVFLETRTRAVSVARAAALPSSSTTMTEDEEELSSSTFNDEDIESLQISEDDRLSRLRARTIRQRTQEELLLRIDAPKAVETGRFEWKRRHSEASLTDLDGTSLLAPVDSTAGVVIERSKPGHSVALQAHGLYEPYMETFASVPHVNFYSEVLEMVVTVSLQATSAHTYRALVRGPTGQELTTITAVRPSSGRSKQETWLLQALEERYSGHEEQQQARTKKIGLVRRLWRVAPPLKPQLVAYEGIVGFQRHLRVGFLYGKPGQTEAEMMQNEFPEECTNFLKEHLQCSQVEMSQFSGYTGGMRSGQAFYTRFSGFEVVVFSAGLMSADEQRKHIGNCKVLLYYFDRASDPEAKLKPQFRGNVNTYAVVVAPRQTDSNYDVGFFRRMGAIAVDPRLPPSIPVPPNVLRETLLYKCTNAERSCYLFLYRSRLNSVYKREVNKVIESFKKKK